jgi:triosephosphate isomerase (TIM)
VNKLRKKIVAGNWKMNKTTADAVRLASDIKMELEDCREVEVVLCPPFTCLKAVGEAISDSSIKLGGQNMHWEADGAYTGEISAGMLRDLYCRFVILGHSERRAFFHETDNDVNRKVKAAIAANLTPIVCIGETLQEREGGLTNNILRTQIEGSLAGLNDDLKKTVVAYEPVWAIGTGKTATPAQAQEAHAFIRSELANLGGKDSADSLRIQYGGSVKPANAAELFSQPDIDGGLIGGASLEVRSFVEIVCAAV